jgi:hypothetical protein
MRGNMNQEQIEINYLRERNEKLTLRVEEYMDMAKSFQMKATALELELSKLRHPSGGGRFD